MSLFCVYAGVAQPPGRCLPNEPSVCCSGVGWLSWSGPCVLLSLFPECSAMHLHRAVRKCWFNCLHFSFFLYSSRPSWAHWGSWAQRVWPWVPQRLPPGSPQSDRRRAHVPRGHAQALDGLQSVILGRTGESSQPRPWYVQSTWPPCPLPERKSSGLTLWIHKHFK